MIATHRGRNLPFRENTISSFDQALKLGCEGVECDLRLTLDNRVVVHHEAHISKTRLKDIAHENLLTIEELFDYINARNVPFYLELKNSSEVLVEQVINQIKERNLWERVHVIGFSFFISSAIKAQTKYPKLKVIQILCIPLSSYIKKPSVSYGVAFGWFDQWFGSEWLFRKLISVERLIKLKKLYEEIGFSQVMTGVINREESFEYFKEAGITDIITDNVVEAVSYFKLHKKTIC